MEIREIVMDLWNTFMPSIEEEKIWNKKQWKRTAIALMNVIVGMMLANQATAEQIKAIKEKMEKV